MSQNQSLEPSDVINRKAIDASGLLGSLYDQRKDCLLEGYNEPNLKGSPVFLKSSHSTLKSGSIGNDFNLLEFIGIEPELRVNLLLNRTARVGIGAVMSYRRYIDEQTRILYYSYTDRKEQVVGEMKVFEMLQSTDPQRIATHIITGIDFGLDLVAIIQLPSDNATVSKIDGALETICLFLRDCANYSTPTIMDTAHFLERHTNLAVYSNTAKFTSLTRISDLLSDIVRYQNSNSCQPITYYLHRTKFLHHQYNYRIKSLPPRVITNIEQCLLQLRTSLLFVESWHKDHRVKSFFGPFLNLMYSIGQQLTSVKDQHMQQTKCLSDSIDDYHRCACDESSVLYALDDQMSALAIQLKQLFDDGRNSEQQQFSNQTVNNFENSSLVNPWQIMNHSNSSSDASSHLYPFDQLRTMSSLTNIEYNERQSKPVPPLSATTTETSVVSTLPPPSKNEMLNILLLGETGVGKSTFINAFVNYLSFDTFEQAELNKPVVLIPVSFLLTVGNDFQERTVKFGDFDKAKNEDFDHPGQSVTQHCKSYTFYLNDGKKLCIIDSPGFGDTRGVEQDNRNMENILEYINNLSHLNAICFLLKPNSSRLNIFFRSCVTQILDLLGPNICRNLTFCFTNARSTFYTPGDTAPLLKAMLKSLTVGKIPFEKDNTFCFDNEAFRYLVALRDGVEFTEENKQEYATSWSISVTESNRLINYVCTKLVLFPEKSDWQSSKHAQFEIMYMIRPMLEAMRNHLRNTILQRISSSPKSIGLKPITLHRPAFLCLGCDQEHFEIEGFLIARECPHEIQDTCLADQCSCSLGQHIRIYHMLDYDVINASEKEDDSLDVLREASGLFAYFLRHRVHAVKADPFDDGILQMIIQESKLSDRQKSNRLNPELVRELGKLQAKYEDTKNRLQSKGENIPLEEIYCWMDRVSQLRVIETQMNAISLGREILMKHHENEHYEI